MPSRKVTSVLIICSALVVMIMMASGKKESSGTNLKSVVAISGKSPQVTVGDNPNWQTDISNTTKGVVVPQEATTTDETLTDTFSRSFMANYLALKQSGSLDQDSATNLINKSVEFINQTNTQKYGLKDIIISPDNSKTALTKYGNDLGSISKTFKQSMGSKNELAILQQILLSENTSNKGELLEISKSYRNLAFSVSKTVVPSKFSASHIKVLNALNTISDSVLDLSFIIEDPFRSLRAIRNYGESYNILTEELRATQVELIKAGVNYKQGENGYYFYFGI